ncbi:MAG: LegC family aminotransferase [Myxococcota bacterium]
MSKRGRTSERIPLSVPTLEASAWSYVKDCLDTGWVSSAGKYVTRFEESVAEYTGASHAVAVCSGTAALHLAYLVAGVSPGDTVLVPTLTFIATVNPVTYLGAKPFFVDVDARTWNVSAETLAAALQQARKAGLRPRHAVVTHLYGVPADMAPIMELCEREGLTLIEDAAESLGSFYRGAHTGTFGRVAALSFNGNKIITTGGGGMILTGDAVLAKRARHLSTQARPNAEVYAHDDVGFNYRLTNLQAALGVSQMESLPRFRDRRREIQKHYLEAFARENWLVPQAQPQGVESNGWLFGVSINSASLTRDQALAALAEVNIEARPVFQPIHEQPMYRGTEARCPVAESVSRVALNLPNSPGISETAVSDVMLTLGKVPASAV